MFLDPTNLQTLNSHTKAQVSSKIHYLIYPNEEMGLTEEPLEIPQNIEYGLSSDVISSFNDGMKTNINACGFDEIEEYLAIAVKENLDHNTFWFLYRKKLPKLFKEYQKMKVLCIANASIERLFSYAKQISFWKRNRISIKRMKALLMSREYLEKNNN